MSMFESEKSLRPVQQMVAQILKAKNGAISGPVLLCSYRKELYGLWFSRILDRAMCLSKEWTRPEAELFAAFTARELGCDF